MAKAAKVVAQGAICWREIYCNAEEKKQLQCGCPTIILPQSDCDVCMEACRIYF